MKRTTSPWRSFVSLQLVIVQVGFGIPSPAAAAPSVAKGAGSGNTGGALTSARALLAAFETRVNLAAKSAISALNPPSEFSRLVSQFEEPLVATSPASPKEDQALLQALRSYRDRAVEDDFTALDTFLKDHPNSAWRVALLTNLGLAHYHYGYFSKAIDSW